MRMLASGLLGAVLAGPVAGQEVTAAWYPEVPVQGTFAYVVIETAPQPTRVRGALDRVPLHFERIGDRHIALGAVRLTADDTVSVALWIERGDGQVQTVQRRLPVRRGSFGSEQLSVDPRFSRALDSALAARVRDENRRAGVVAGRAMETPRLWEYPFQMPRASRVTSPYGRGRVFNGELRSRHWGTDFDGEFGDPVVAANRAVVELVDEFYYGGRVIYLNHGAGLVTAYMHLQEQLVAAGDTVEKGQLIGRVGATGRVTGPHLHWTVRLGRATVDGTSLLALPPPWIASTRGAP